MKKEDMNSPAHIHKTAYTKTPWGLVMILVGAGILAAFQVEKAPPVLPEIKKELGLSLFQPTPFSGLPSWDFFPRS